MATSLKSNMKIASVQPLKLASSLSTVPSRGALRPVRLPPQTKPPKFKTK